MTFNQHLEEDGLSPEVAGIGLLDAGARGEMRSRRCERNMVRYARRDTPWKLAPFSPETDSALRSRPKGFSASNGGPER